MLTRKFKKTLAQVNQALAKIFIIIVFSYQILFRSIFTGSCRFYPGCSDYAIKSLELYGVRGLKLIFKRLIRCHPWSKGGFDPIS